MRRVLWIAMVGIALWLSAETAAALEPRGYIGKDQPWETPYYVIQGEKNGPTVMVIGGTHGDETAGWRAAEQLLGAAIDCGKLVVIPQANRHAVRQNLRAVPAEGNLNRAYPGKQDGNHTEKLAFGIMELIRAARPVIVLDLHESNGFYSEGKEFIGQTIIPFVDERSVRLAQATVDRVNLRIAEGPERFAVLIGPVQGSTAYAVGRYLEIAAFTVETTTKMALDERIEHQILVVRMMLKAIGVTLTCKPHF